MISEEQRAREIEIAQRMKAPRPMAAYYAGRCRCGARWLPGDVIVRSPMKGGPPPCCLDCGIKAAEAAR